MPRGLTSFSGITAESFPQARRSLARIHDVDLHPGPEFESTLLSEPRNDLQEPVKPGALRQGTVLKDPVEGNRPESIAHGSEGGLHEQRQLSGFGAHVANRGGVNPRDD